MFTVLLKIWAMVTIATERSESDVNSRLLAFILFYFSCGHQTPSRAIGYGNLSRRKASFPVPLFLFFFFLKGDREVFTAWEKRYFTTYYIVIVHTRRWKEGGKAKASHDGEKRLSHENNHSTKSPNVYYAQ